MPRVIGLLVFAGVLCCLAVFAQAAGGKRCFFIGGYPAAETKELLAKAQSMVDVNDDAGLTALRASGQVLMPQGKPAGSVACGPDDLCQVTVFGKQLWIMKNGLQCQ